MRRGGRGSGEKGGCSYSFVGLLLAGVFRGLGGVAADLHVHGVDDVEEIFHDGHSLQGRVDSRDAVHALETEPRESTPSGHRKQSDDEQPHSNRGPAFNSNLPYANTVRPPLVNWLRGARRQINTRYLFNCQSFIVQICHQISELGGV